MNPLRVCVRASGLYGRRLLLLLVLAGGLSCGIKAPPVPRETVVPSAVLDLSARVEGEGVLLEFTLPATRLDGGRLAKIAGYRVLRTGPENRQEQRDVRFSFSQQSGMVGKRVSILDPHPERPGTYRYSVLPLDAYGSHPRGNAWAEVSFDALRP